MPQQIPTTQALTNLILSFLETNLSQEAPLQDKAFLRVKSVVLGAVGTMFFKFLAQQTLETLALTASREGLIVIGTNYNVPIKQAEAAQLTAELPATSGTVITTNIGYIGDANGASYSLDAQVIASVSNIATLQLTAQIAGDAGNLLVGDTLQITSQIPGAETTATVTVVTNTGANAESTEAYRQRVLNKVRTQGGGGNYADYREWGNEVAGVDNTYPYSQRPDQPIPGGLADRTVFVEAEATTGNPDGIPAQPLLDEVKSVILTDPVTGLSRQPVHLGASTLYVIAITRTGFFVVINGLDVSVDQEAQVKLDIASSLTTYFLSLSPFIEGLDPVDSKNDIITNPTITEVVQGIVKSAGGVFNSLSFNTGAGAFSTYDLGAGEHAKLGADPTYV